MAGGDHLHFGILLQGLPVDPREWWDGHWIQDRLALKLGEKTGEAFWIEVESGPADRGSTPSDREVVRALISSRITDLAWGR